MEQNLPRILIVDDEPDMCWALANILRPAGYTITTAVSAAEALVLLSGRGDPDDAPYAAAFVDAKLPDLDGLELAYLIRQQSPHTAVVLISGYFYREDSTITTGLEKGLFVGFVAKPFDLRQVRLMASLAVAGKTTGTSAGKTTGTSAGKTTGASAGKTTGALAGKTTGTSEQGKEENHAARSHSSGG